MARGTRSCRFADAAAGGVVRDRQHRRADRGARRPAGEGFELGALATAWPRLRGSASLGELRAGLAASAWQDPGGDSGLEVRVGVRARWAQRAAALGRPAPAWAAGAAAMLVAGERLAADRPLNPAVQGVAHSLLGAAADAATYAELRDRLPARLAWVLEPARPRTTCGAPRPPGTPRRVLGGLVLPRRGGDRRLAGAPWRSWVVGAAGPAGRAARRRGPYRRARRAHGRNRAAARPAGYDPGRPAGP
jgi:hypothetical protein